MLTDITDITSIKALTAAWQKFSRGKTSRFDVIAYQKDLKTNILQLHQTVSSGQYRHGPYHAFTIHDPKQRRIHKATVQDRLMHQAIVSAIEPAFERRFIHDSYSCRKGKGTHAGVARLQVFLRRTSGNNTKKAYALKCDISRYFASIDHEILMHLIARRVHDEATLELIRTVLLSHGDEVGRGFPLGNVTSQLFANIYLHELDWFVKQHLRVSQYVRYCDDFVIVSTDQAYLGSLITPIRRFLQTQLLLDLHPAKVTIRSWAQGVDFLGYVLRPQAITLRTKTRRRMITKVTKHNLSSYIGLCAHAQAHHVSQLLRTIAWEREVPYETASQANPDT